MEPTYIYLAATLFQVYLIVSLARKYRKQLRNLGYSVVSWQEKYMKLEDDYLEAIEYVQDNSLWQSIARDKFGTWKFISVEVDNGKCYTYIFPKQYSFAKALSEADEQFYQAEMVKKEAKRFEKVHIHKGNIDS